MMSMGAIISSPVVVDGMWFMSEVRTGICMR